MKWVALVDCNTFYCSCERLMRPELKNRPVIVLSNNDGCAIALSSEAKALGYSIGTPFFEIRKQVKKYNIAFFSSNYTLYQNLSNRVMATLETVSPTLEVYSIDEAFLDFSIFSSEELFSHGLEIHKKVLKWTGIPVSLGIASTKVLAKAANRFAKKASAQVVVIKGESDADEVLKATIIDDVWGVGRSLAVKLKLHGIKTAYDFKHFTNDRVIQSIGTKVLRKVQDELRGIACLSMLEVKKKEMILSSKSFGKTVWDEKDLKEAVANYISRAAEKLRAQGSRAKNLSISVRTNLFSQDPFYRGADEVSFETPTMDTFKMIEESHKILKGIYKPGIGYKKATVCLTGLESEGEQMNFFTPVSEDKIGLMKVMDDINRRYGKGVIKSGACGLGNPWKGLCEHRSPRYTTRLFEARRVA
jgi:DNA polymerase V